MSQRNLTNLQNFISTIYKMSEKDIITTITIGEGALWLQYSQTYQKNSWENQELLNFRAWALNQIHGHNHP